MKITSQYHVHSSYSKDAKPNIEDIVKVAIELGYEEIGISDHGPGHLFYGINLDKLKRSSQEIDRLNEKYPQISILQGIEANIINLKGDLCLKDKHMDYVDYIVAGYHYGSYSNNIASDVIMHIKNRSKLNTLKWRDRNTTMICNAIKNNNIKLLSHPGSKCPIFPYEVAKVAYENDTCLEINYFHKNFNKSIINVLNDTGVNFLISSDAHELHEIKLADEVIPIVEESNLDPSRVLNLQE